MNEVVLRQRNGDQSLCTYRDLALDDIDALCSVHMLAFNRSLLASLGVDVVRRYYRWLLSSPGSVCNVGAFIDGRIVGLAILSNSYRFRSFLQHDWALVSIRMAMSPRSVIRRNLLRTLWPAQESRIGPNFAWMSSQSSQGLYCRLLLFAITPEYQSKGFGKALLNAVEKRGHEVGYKGFYLSVHRTNAKAIALYSTSGWEKIMIESHWGGWMLKRLAGAGEPAVQGHKRTAAFNQNSRSRQFRDRLVDAKQRLSQSVVIHGLSPTLYRVFPRFIDHLYDAWFDHRYETDTAMRVRIDQFDIDGGTVPNFAHGSQCQSTSTRILRGVLRELRATRIDFSDWTFIDYGSGKGKALLLASDFGFGKVLGIEYSPRLCDIARRNAASFTSKKHSLRSIEVVCVDATQYELPTHSCVYYMFNPFDETVLRAVLGNIKSSRRHTNIPAYLVYVNPSLSRVMEEQAWLIPISRKRDFIVYEAQGGKEQDIL